MYIAIGPTDNGTDVVDDINVRDKSYLREKINRLSSNRISTCKRLVMSVSQLLFLWINTKIF